MTHLQTNVVVIGTGAMGSASLWQLAERGIPAIGFERFEPGHNRGSSHGETRIFRTAYLEGPGYVPLAQRAVVLWRKLQEGSPVPLMKENGALMLGPQDSAVITGTLESIRTHHLPHRLLHETEIREQYPNHRVAPGEVAIQENEAGFVRPENAVMEMARRAEEQGARIMRGTKIDGIDLHTDGVRITAGDVVCDAHHAIISVGAWLGTILPDLHLPLRVTRQVLAWFRIDHPERFAPERFPVFIRDIGGNSSVSELLTGDGSFYGFPTLDGETIKVAIHREGRETSPDAVDRTVTPADLEPIQGHIRRFLNGVGTDAVRTQVCIYTNTPDHDFLIGSPARMPQITVLGGFSGHGFKFAPVIGEIGADLATTGATRHPVQWLTPNRFITERIL